MGVKVNVDVLFLHSTHIDVILGMVNLAVIGMVAF